MEESSFETSPNAIVGPPVGPPVSNPGIQIKVNLSVFRAIAKTSNAYNYTILDLGSGSYSVGEDDYIVIDNVSMLEDAANKLKVQYPVDFDVTQFVKDLEPILDALEGKEPEVFAIAKQFPELKTYYNNKQLGLLDTYFNSMANATTLSEVRATYAITYDDINAQGYLTKEQKASIIGIVEYANQYALQFFVDEADKGVNAVRKDLYDFASKLGRPLPSNIQQSSACTVRFRDVWRAGVCAGAAGAIRGALAGAVGGTVIPGAGTVSGALAGGVYGFASGFAVGAGADVAYQVIWGCMFGSPMQTHDDEWWKQECASVFLKGNAYNQEHIRLCQRWASRYYRRFKLPQN